MAQIVSGVPLFSGTVDGPSAEGKSYNVLFNARSINTTSHVVEVNQNAIVVRAFNLQAGQFIQVDMIGNDGVTTVTTSLVLNAKPVKLTTDNTAIVIDLPGKYQFHLVGGLGTVSAMFFESGMPYWSYGLSNFAMAS
jgi:hypothetical protein